MLSFIYIFVHAQVAEILSTDPFVKFEKTATTLVRSENLTAEDKVALGTIKRYGTHGS